MTYHTSDNHPAFPTQLPGTSGNSKAWSLVPMPSLKELRERNDHAHGDHFPPPTHERPSRYPVCFAQAKLAVLSAILL
jgi:hypothetical protein